MTSHAGSATRSSGSGGEVLSLITDTVITPDRALTPGHVSIRKGRVDSVGVGEPPSGPAPLALPAGCVVVPGLVEMHVHGAGGGNMTALSPAEVNTARAALLMSGVTTTVASLITAEIAELEEAVELLAVLAEQPVQGLARLVGSHLEGPFLSAEHRGAHDQGLLKFPDVDVARRLLSVGRGTVRMMTLAPELPGAERLISELRNQGVTPAMGHTGASYEQTHTAISWGIRVGTHLFNGMAGAHHRAPGPALSLLDDPRVTVELINDGVHVHPVVARMATRAAHEGRLALISDGVAATGAPEGEYWLGHTRIRSHAGRVETADGTSLGGGARSLAEGLRRAVQVLGMPLEAAVAAATTVPANALGIGDRAGCLATGRQADLCVLNADLQVVGVMLGGEWVVDPMDSQRDSGHAPNTTGAL